MERTFSFPSPGRNRRRRFGPQRFWGEVDELYPSTFSTTLKPASFGVKASARADFFFFPLLQSGGHRFSFFFWKQRLSFPSQKTDRLPSFPSLDNWNPPPPSKDPQRRCRPFPSPPESRAFKPRLFSEKIKRLLSPPLDGVGTLLQPPFSPSTAPPRSSTAGTPLSPLASA